ncbi:MAG: hypothetical protein O3A18_01575 [Planctomycetota bacterium]|nr:hypothetical protein [Planctomycetota bacterium]
MYCTDLKPVRAAITLSGRSVWTTNRRTAATRCRTKASWIDRPTTSRNRCSSVDRETQASAA